MQISSQFYPTIQKRNILKPSHFAGQPVEPFIKQEYVSPADLNVGDHILVTWPNHNQIQPLEHVVLWTEDKGGIPVSVKASLFPPNHYLIGVQWANGKSTDEQVYFIRKPVQEEDVVRLLKP